MLSRRQALTLTASAAGAAATGVFGRGAVAAVPPRQDRIPYGACVRLDPLKGEIAYRTALQNHCQELTSEGGLFWATQRPARGVASGRVRPESGDPPEGLVPEDRRHGARASAVHRVQVAAAERARDDLHQDLGTLRIRGRKRPQLERTPRAMEDEGVRESAHDAAPADTSARPRPVK